MKRTLPSLVLACASLAASKTATTEKPAAPPQSTAGKAGSIEAGTQVATMDGQPITYADLEKEQKDLATKVKQREVQYLTDVYELRKDALDNLIAKRLPEGEAKKVNK